jgi:hypothetical protein
MSSEFQQLPNEPIVIVTLHKGYDLRAELPVTLPGYLKFLDAAPNPVFWIVDARDSNMTLEDVQQGASLVARGTHPLYLHPKIRQVIYITSSQLLRMAAVGMQSDIFGKVNIKLFDNLDEALQFVRAA